MYHDRKEADMVEEGKSGREGLEVFGDDGAADFDDSKLLGRDGAEVGEVLLDFSFGANVAQKLDDGRSRRQVGIWR